MHNAYQFCFDYIPGALCFKSNSLFIIETMNKTIPKLSRKILFHDIRIVKDTLKVICIFRRIKEFSHKVISIIFYL
jgi:hypothetical protein